MRFSIAACPECGQAPTYILESMLIRYDIEADDDGEFEYTGDSEEFVETAEPIRNAEDQATVGCADRHEWDTAMAQDVR